MTMHYKLSPSGMGRILVCPGSLLHNGESRSSSYAEEGTQAHDLAARLLRDKLFRHQNIYPAGEMYTAANVYADHCFSLLTATLDNFDSGEYEIEKTLESSTIPNFGGTPDFYVVQGETFAHVVDFKYGVGIPVVAERNPQLLSYAVLLTERYPSIRHFTLTIVQPRTAGEPIDSWECSRAEVDAFAARIKAAAGQSTYAAGDHCRFCPHRMTCDTLYQLTADVAGTEFSDLTTDRLADLWRKTKAIKGLLDAIPEHFLGLMRKGQTIPGFKAVKSVGNRVWKWDEKAILKELVKMKVGKRIACETSLRSPTSLEKEGYKIDDLTMRPDRGLTVVEDRDKRPAYVFETVADQFDDLSFLD